MKDLQAIRDALHKLRPKTIDDLDEDTDTLRAKNLSEILSEYDKISKLAKDLIPLKGKTLHEALSNQASEFYFFRLCSGNLKAMLDYHEALLRHIKAVAYRDIENRTSKAHNDRAIQTLIEESDIVFNVMRDIVLIKAMCDRFGGIIESYNQRGYSLNNITKALEIAMMETLL